MSWSFPEAKVAVTVFDMRLQVLTVQGQELMTKDKLVDDMSRTLQGRYPGVDFSFSQIIEDNVEDAADNTTRFVVPARRPLG